MKSFSEDCALKNFSNPDLKGVLLGLDEFKGKLIFDDKIFSCCKGTGYRFHDNTAQRCDLAWRLSNIKKLFSQYNSIYGKSNKLFPKDLNNLNSDLIMKTLNNLLLSPRYVEINKSLNSTSSLWPFAFATIWRFGLRCHFISFSKTPKNKLIPEPSLDERNRDTIIFVSLIDNLFKTELAFDFDLIVSYAYKSNYYLFLEFIEHNKEATSSKNRSSFYKNKGYFSKKISNLQNRPHKDFLSENCLSRLEQMYCSPLNI